MENNENYEYLENVMILNIDAENVGSLNLNPLVFGKEYFPDIINRVVNWQLLKRMSGTHKTKLIGDISGTTKRTHRQKGTGSARQGSLRSPHHRGGAVTFGPVVRSHAIKLPKRIRRLGLAIALSVKMASNKLIILDKLSLSSCKTQDFKSMFTNFNNKILNPHNDNNEHEHVHNENCDHEHEDFKKPKKKLPSALFIDNEICNNLKNAVSNLYRMDVIPEIGLNVYDILRHDYLFITQDAIKKLEERLCR